MHSFHNFFRIALIVLYVFTAGSLIAQDLAKTTSKKITLQYISSTDLIDANIAKADTVSTVNGNVAIKINSSTNEILLLGSESAIQIASSMIEFLDVPPRQIIVEVKIIEIDNQKIKQAGIDWQQILSKTSIPFQYRYNRTKSSSTSEDNSLQSNTGSSPYNSNAQSSSDRISNSNATDFGISNSMRISDFLNILEGSDGAKILNVPKIVTINNKKGTILDGSRIIYIDKYASYSNLFQTQEMKTGLFLSVTPTIGSSGFVKMNVEAKLTNLSSTGNDLRPTEVGQMLENIVVVKEGESIMLGGLKKTSTQKVESSVPILGSILPFLFSSTKNVEVTNDVLLILTPTVVNLTKMDIPDLLNEKTNK
jgi:type II secretory pathway component GspD/PulD (secretin)